MSNESEAEGKERPWPTKAGAIRQVYIQEGKLFPMNASSIDPIRIKVYPIMSVGFIFLDQVMMRPTENPATILRRNGRMRRVPEFVALSSKTA
jgi:hypothetical protein